MPKKILVADDSLTLRNVAEPLLRKRGYEVLFADDGAKALSMAQADKPDLMFLNNSISGLSGAQVCRELKQNELLQDVPVVVILSADEKQIERDLRQIGVEAFMTKPFDPKELLDHVERLLHPGRASGSEEEEKPSPDSSSKKEKTPGKEDAAAAAAPTEEVKAEDSLNILDTSDLVDTSGAEVVHSFEWFVHELKKEAQGGQAADSHAKHKPKPPPERTKDEKIELKEESKAYEISEHEKGYEGFLKDLKVDLGEPEIRRSAPTQPPPAGKESPSVSDQLFSDLKERIAERIAREVAKKISPEFLERIIREEMDKVKTDSS